MSAQIKYAYLKGHTWLFRRNYTSCPNGQVARINAAAIVAEMADDLITVGGSLTWLKNFGIFPMLQ